MNDKIIKELVDDELEIYKDEQAVDTVFLKKAYGVITCNKDGRYIAIGDVGKIHIYDCENKSFITIPYKSKYIRTELRFDSNDNIYYVDGNNLGVIDLQTREDVLLYNIGKQQHGPQNLSVSPEGRYISFWRYRNGNKSLFLYDIKTGECKDCKVSLYHYSWLNDKNIVWSQGGGLKLLDVDTGKSQILIKDHISLMKKCDSEDAKLFDIFKQVDKAKLYTDLNLIRVINNKIYFSLAINYFDDNTKHYGIWYIDIEKEEAKFCYTFPDDYRKAGSGYKFLIKNGKLAWNINEKWNIFDGERTDTLSNDWKQAVCYDIV